MCPVIDVIDDTTLEYHWHDSSGVNVGGFDWNLQFNWHAVPDRERKRHSSTAEPVATPTMAGGLFSINKKFFERLGNYDNGFDIWGGENLELSFKVFLTYKFRKKFINSPTLFLVVMFIFYSYIYHRLGCVVERSKLCLVHMLVTYSENGHRTNGEQV